MSIMNRKSNIDELLDFDRSFDETRRLPVTGTATTNIDGREEAEDSNEVEKQLVPVGAVLELHVAVSVRLFEDVGEFAHFIQPKCNNSDVVKRCHLSQLVSLVLLHPKYCCILATL